MARPLDWARDGRDWPNRQSSRFLSAGGLRWHVQEMGAGPGRPSILLLHGTGASTHSWRHVAPLLARDAHVILADLPGHGFTEPARDATLPGMGAAVAQLISEIPHGPLLVVGHSAGAAIGARMLLDHRVEAAGLVGVGAALLPFPGAAAALFPTAARLLFANPFVPELFAVGARLSGNVGSFLERSTGSRIDAEGLAIYGRLFSHGGHVSGALAMMANWDLAPLARDMPRLGVRLHLMHGTKDAAVPVDTAVGLAAKLPDASLEVWDGAGHLLHEEDPVRFVTQLGRQLAAA